CPFHSRCDGAVDHTGANKIAKISRFAASAVNFEAIRPEHFQHLFSPLDDCADHLAWYQRLVTANCRGKQNARSDAYAQEVVYIHDDGILRDPFPYRRVACFLPVEISERRLGAGAVCVHDVAEVGITADMVFHYLAEGRWTESLVQVADGLMFIFRGSRTSAAAIPV